MAKEEKKPAPAARQPSEPLDKFSQNFDLAHWTKVVSALMAAIVLNRELEIAQPSQGLGRQLQKPVSARGQRRRPAAPKLPARRKCLYPVGMVTAQEFLAQIYYFLESRRMAASAFGRAAVNDPNLVGDLRSGRMPNLRTLARVQEFIDSQPEPASEQSDAPEAPSEPERAAS